MEVGLNLLSWVDVFFILNPPWKALSRQRRIHTQPPINDESGQQRRTTTEALYVAMFRSNSIGGE
jgi:hypothetical protein